jgi:hypothetical protein
MRNRTRWLALGSFALLTITLAAVILLTRFPSFMYRLTGSQRHFNLAVSRAIPKGATLAQLEAEVGRGRLVNAPPWMREMVRREPSRYTDGWREGDTCVSYSFPGKSTWYFQVRDGRLVNYNPSVLAGQPQEHLAGIRPFAVIRP